MKIPIEIQTHNHRLCFSLLESDRYETGMTIDAPGGAKVEAVSLRAFRAESIPQILEVIVHTSAALELSLFSAWLYDKVKPKENPKGQNGMGETEKIIIGSEEITEISESKITHTLKTQIEIHRPSGPGT